MNTENRKWLRLVGLYHDVQLWKPDTREIRHPFNRFYVGGLRGGEQWIHNAIEPHRKKLLNGIDLMLPESDFSQLCYANLCGYSTTGSSQDRNLTRTLTKP